MTRPNGVVVWIVVREFHFQLASRVFRSVRAIGSISVSSGCGAREISANISMRKRRGLLRWFQTVESGVD